MAVSEEGPALSNAATGETPLRRAISGRMLMVLVVGDVLLLLLVFTIVNVAVLVLRRDAVAHHHFRAPTVIPVIGAVVSVALMTTKDLAIFGRAGLLLVIGSALWALNWWLHGRHVDPYDTGQMRAVERGGRD